MKHGSLLHNVMVARKPICKCGKIIFDKKGAQTKKNELEKMGKEKRLRVYHCPLCNMWHLTKK